MFSVMLRIVLYIQELKTVVQIIAGKWVDEIVKHGADNTFLVKILNKQNATWQGTVTWVEEQQVQNFRSALELLKLIDGAIEEKER